MEAAVGGYIMWYSHYYNAHSEDIVGEIPLHFLNCDYSHKSIFPFPFSVVNKIKKVKKLHITVVT